MNPDEQQSSKKWLWIGLGVFFLLLLAGGLLWYFFGGTKPGGGAGELFPFGAPSEGGDVRTDTDADRHEIGGEEGGGFEDVGAERLFRQLANVPVAGAYALERSGEQYIRYIEKETGHAYEIALEAGEARQLTNTTIPRIAIADWADNGNAVVLRYLEEDPLSGREVIKTYLGRLALSSASGTDMTGSLTMEFLPDNIIALSVAQDGKDFFYLIKKGSEVVGSIVNLNTRTTKEVFRNSFSEWTPQLLNDDTIILTTKPSGAVPGYSYLYDPKTKALKRLVREKDALTMLGTPSGSRALYGENVAGNAALNAYNPKGFAGDEGFVFYEKTLPITTLPEKCAWLEDGIQALCGAFISTPRGVPDLWYKGALFFSDTFWSLNTDTDEISYLADPKEETGQEFDVTNPILSRDEQYFIFTNKRDSTLWAMRIPQKTPPADLSHDELPAVN
ncbi:MAG: hypothetical protein Q7S52_01605 [bacterium]|nr:hypothetical protein [bacterium]